MNKQTGNEIAIEQQLDDIFDAIQMLRKEVKELKKMVIDLICELQPINEDVRENFPPETPEQLPLLY